MPEFSPDAIPGFELIQSIGRAFAAFSWLWLMLLLGYIFKSILLRWRQNLYLAKNPLIVLEVRIPRETVRGPKAMEQFFANLHGLVNAPGNWYEKYVDGEVPHSIGLEIASFGGDVHFFISAPEKHRGMVEAHLYAQYPDLEILLAEDYIDKMPSTMQEVFDIGYDMMGVELALGESDAYPIRTYAEFESLLDAQNIDPIAALIENMAKIKPDEHLWLQMIIRPAQGDWTAVGEKEIERLNKKNTVIKKVVKDGVTEKVEIPGKLSATEAEAIKAIQQNISKSAFETVIRYVYFAPQKSFNVNFGKRAVTSSFNQYRAHSLNFFKGNGGVSTYTHWAMWPHLFAKKRMNTRKMNMLFSYRTRYIKEQPKFRNLLFGRMTSSKYFYMNIEELATIFHFPNSTVLTAPFIQRLESRRIGPPAGLPIFSEGGKNTTGFRFGAQKNQPDSSKDK